jgi:2-oxoglutarate ferredoxin oxidoreductase subunit beta
VRDPATGALRVATVRSAENPDGVDPAEVLVHDAHADDPTTAFALSRLTDSGVLHQAPIGIFRQVDHPTYDDQARDQVATARQGTDDRQAALATLLSSGDTWQVG